MSRIKIHLIGVKELIIEADDPKALMAAIAGIVTDSDDSDDSDDDDEEPTVFTVNAETVIQNDPNPYQFGFTPWSTHYTHAWLWEEDRGSRMGQQRFRPGFSGS